MPELTPPNRKRPTPVLMGVGVLVVALGFALPQFTPPTTTGPTPDTPDAPAPVATATESSPGSVRPPDAALVPALARLAGGLAVVCVLCVLATRYLARTTTQPTAAMKVLGTIAVGRCVVHLVSAGGRRLLVGIDPGGVKALVELPGEPEPDATPEAVTEATPTSAEGVVVGPVSMPVPAAPTPARNEVLELLAKALERNGSPASG